VISRLRVSFAFELGDFCLVSGGLRDVLGMIAEGVGDLVGV